MPKIKFFLEIAYPMQNFVLIIFSYYAKIVRRHPRALGPDFKHVVLVMFQYAFFGFLRKIA